MYFLSENAGLWNFPSLPWWRKFPATFNPWIPTVIGKVMLLSCTIISLLPVLFRLYIKHKRRPPKAAGLLTKIMQFCVHQYSRMRKSVCRHLSCMEAFDTFSWHGLEVMGKSVLQPQTNYLSVTLRSQFSLHLAQIFYCYPHRWNLDMLLAAALFLHHLWLVNSNHF